MSKLIFSEEQCVMCGAVIPEGRQVCMECEQRVMKSKEMETGKNSTDRETNIERRRRM